MPPSVNPSPHVGVQRQPQRLESSVSRWPRMMLMTAASSAWLICDMATATEAPGQAVAVVQYALLVCVLFGRAGSLAMQASLK